MSLFKEWEIRIGCWILIIAIVALAYGCLKDGGNIMGKIQEVKTRTEEINNNLGNRLKELEQAPKWYGK